WVAVWNKLQRNVQVDLCARRHFTGARSFASLKLALNQPEILSSMAVSPGWQHARARLFVPAPHLFQLVGGDVVEVAPAVLILLVEPVVARFALILGACDKRDHPYYQREQDTRQRDPQESPDLIRYKIFPSRAPG